MMENNLMLQECLPGFGEEPPRRGKVYPGSKFNRLVVVKRAGQAKDGHSIYQCRCECGNVVDAQINNLRSGNTKSCGCLQRENKEQESMIAYDMTGQQYGSLIAVRENGRNKKGEIIWLFRCKKCGREKSLMGRMVRKFPNRKRCDHGESARKGAKTKGIKTRKKPRNNEQYALDIYNMYIKKGCSVRDAAAEEGYKVGSSFTALLMKHVPEYKEKSIKRRNESKWARTMESSKKKSNLFRYEKDLQAACVAKLKNRGVIVKENDKETTGFEIDIKTNQNCYELKVTTPKKDIYRAMGQLDINTVKTKLKPVLVIPSDTTMAKSMMDVLESKGIAVMTELTI